MVTVRLGPDQRTWHTRRDVDERWIMEQVNNRRRRAEPVCLSVQVVAPGIGLSLISPECPNRPGGLRRALTDGERAILTVWQRHIVSRQFHGGDVVAFLAELPCWQGS